MVSPWFGDLLRPCDIVSDQMSLQVFDFLIIHRQSHSFRSLLPCMLLFLLILRLWSSWSPSRSNLVDPRCFLSRVCGHLCPVFPHFSFPHQDWVATMCSSSRRCPFPLGPSLPPCSLLVVQSGGNFRRVVSKGSLPSLDCLLVFADGCKSYSLLFFPVRFHILRVRCCGFSTGLADPRFTHPALRWPGISPVESVPSSLPSPLLSLQLGAVVLVFWVSAGLAVPVPFRLV